MGKRRIHRGQIKREIWSFFKIGEKSCKMQINLHISKKSRIFARYRAAIIVRGICRDKKIAQKEKDKLLYNAARVYHRAIEGA